MGELSAARRWASLSVLIGAVLLLAIDSTVLYLAVPALTEDLDATATEVLWIGDIYSLAIAGLLVTMGNLADRIGRKRLLLCGAGAFGLASALAAFAPTAGVLIAARLLLGVAGATLMPSTLSLIRNIFPDQAERTRAIAIWSAASAAGIAIGPIVGGILLEHFWWGSVFLINIPVILLVIGFGAWLLPESRGQAAGRFDLISSALSMLAIIPLVFAIKQVATGAFDLAFAISIVASLAGWILFARRQRRVEDPMIDITLFRNAAFSGAVLADFISVFALSGVLFFLAQYLQLVRGLGPFEAGLAQLPAAIAAMLAATLVSAAHRALGRGRAIAAALTVGAVGVGAMAFGEGSDHLIWLLLALVPLGLGIGIAETLSVDAIVTAVPPEKSGAASSISETAYELGIAFGIAVLGSLMTIRYRAGLSLPGDLTPDVADHVRESLATAASHLPDDSPTLLAAQSAFSHAMQDTTLVAGAIMLLAAVVAYFLIPSNRTGSVDAR